METVKLKVKKYFEEYPLFFIKDENDDKLYFDPHATEQHMNQVIFELIKDTYIEESRKETKTIHSLSSGILADAERKKNMRTMHFANYYRDELAKEFLDKFGEVPAELKKIDMTDSNNRSNGYKISKYDHETMRAMQELKLLKYLSSKRIKSVKKISNFELDVVYQEYREYFKKIYKSITCDSDYIMYSILLFTTELKYNIETIYKLASKLSEHNSCKSKNKFSDDYIPTVSVFSRPLYCDIEGFHFIKENSLYMMKSELIKILHPNNINSILPFYHFNLQHAFYIKQMILAETNIKDLIRKISDAEKRKFIEEHYNIWEVLDEELSWENKKTKHLRDIFDFIIKDIEPPKIK